MDRKEIRSLEEKTRKIVDTLSELEDETSRQRRMGDQLEQGKEAVLAAASRLSGAADGLADAIALLQRSTLAEDLERLSSRIDDVRELTDLARDEARRAEEALRATDELASSVEASVKDANDKLDGIRDSCEELLKAVGTAEEASARRDAEFSKRLDELEGVLGRIDRNTQKGFGKERA